MTVRKVNCSELVSANPDSDDRMPPKGPMLGAGQVALLKQWIDEGAVWPEVAGPSQAVRHNEMTVTDEDRRHWSFLPIKLSAPPPVNAIESAPAVIDRFVESDLEHEGFGFRPSAPRRKLIRRAYFDLVGLPPEPEEIEEFVNDPDPQAYEKLIERLLASPHYGERWGRHWLDLARYADSDGYESDVDRPLAWPYRDWVIRALNADLPFDTFVKWQVAGDEYAPENADAVCATGFLAAGPWQTTTPADTEENKQKLRYDELDDIVATVGSSMLGLTLGCARCHDHKFDPIPTRDYYRMVTAFSTSARMETFLSKPRRELELWKAQQHKAYRETKMTELGLSEEEKFWLRQPEHSSVPIQQRIYQRYGTQVKATDDQLRAWLPEKQRAVWQALESASTKDGNMARALLVIDTQSEPMPGYLLERGSVLSRKESLTAGFMQVLLRGRSGEEYFPVASSLPTQSEVDDSGFKRLASTFQREALAEWLTDPNQGAGNLLARVIVNRLWQHHFGEGLVRTPNDFGAQGAAPADPALLDWLAGELIRGGWKLKPLHRLIMESTAYRQDVIGPGANGQPSVSGSEASLFRRHPLRLEAEAMRDALLSVSGRLNPQMFGPPFRPIISKAAIATRSKDPYPTDIQDGPEICRRSIYAFIKRSVRNPMMEVFDAPDPTASCGRRETTTIATQALTLMNDDFVRGCAVQFATRVVREAGEDQQKQVERAYLLGLGRLPSDLELNKAETFLSAGSKDHGANPVKASLADLCQVLFTLNEFVYID